MTKMDRVISGKSLPVALSILDRGVAPSSHEVVDCGNASLVRDVRCREFCERTSGAAH